MRTVSACILAGGLGTRIRPAIGDCPKALAPIAGQPFITYLLDRIEAAGIRHAVLCTGYLSEKIQRDLSEQYKTIELTYSTEQTRLGTGGAVRNALPHFRSNQILACNGDSICFVDFSAFMESHVQRKARASMVLAVSPDCSRFGTVEVGQDGRVRKFQEKGTHTGPGLINAGMYLLDTSVVSAIPAGREVSLEYEVFPDLVGKDFFGYVYEGPFFDIGTPDSFAATDRYFRERLQQRTLV